jgi:branched-chain amino acid transport system permease protein
MLQWQWSFWAALPVTLLAGAIVAVILGMPTLRLAGAYFALGTFAFGEIVRAVFQRFTVPFGGSQGLFSIPAPHPIGVPGVFAITFTSGYGLYYLLLAALVAFTLLYHRYVESSIGLRLRAISSAEQLAQATGVSARAYRLATFVICALGAVVAGALYAGMAHYIEPALFGSVRSIDAQAYVIVGGQASVLGPLLGAVFLSLLGEALGLAREAGPIVTALAMLAAVFFVHGGLLGAASASTQRVGRLLRARRARYGIRPSR